MTASDPNPSEPSASLPTPGAPAASPDAARGATRRRRYLAGFLTTLVPGLGHLVLGRRRSALVLVAPMLVLLVATVALAVTNERTTLAARFVDPDVLAGMIVLQLGVLAWRLLALGASLFAARPPRYGGRDLLPVALLVALVLGPQLALADVTNAAREASLEVFAASRLTQGSVWQPVATPSSTGDPVATPEPTPSPEPLGSRTTILLIGEDSGPNRNTALTDTMIVASLDPVARTVSMLSVPRDLVDAPIPGGGVYRGKINSLAAWARRHPDAFPGSNGNGEGVLAAVIAELIQVRIDQWAKVNLPGMQSLIDRVGGVDITITRKWCDPSYRQYGQVSFGVKPGRWHLNGSQALAYARVRKAAGESDFTRAARQQEVLIALRDAVVRGGFVNDPIGFLRALGQTVSTSVPPDLIASLAGYATQIRLEDVYRAVITYPLISESSGDGRGWVELPNLPRIRALAQVLFPEVGTQPSLPKTGSGITFGYVPGASATPKPSASATASAVASPTPSPTPAPIVSTTRAPNLPVITCTYATSPSSTATPSPTATPVPSPTATPVPSDSATPTPDPTPTPTPPHGPTPPPAPTPTPTAPSPTPCTKPKC